MTALLQLDAITRHFDLAGQSVQAIARLSLTIEAGDEVAISGHSGSGKSTLLHILGLLDRVSSGEVYFAGQPTSGLSAEARAHLRNCHIGFVYQAFHLIPWMSALENVALPLTYAASRHSAAQIHTAARQMLDAVGLEHRLNAQANNLSGGEKQRVAIARALVTHPRVLLADEPTGALDEENSARIMQLLRTLAAQSGAALIMVTHDSRLAASFARQLVMQHGQLRERQATAAA